MTNNELLAVLAQNVRKLLEKKNWSQSDLARQALISQPYVSQIAYQNAGNPSINTLVLLANAFEVEPYELIKVG